MAETENCPPGTLEEWILKSSSLTEIEHLPRNRQVNDRYLLAESLWTQFFSCVTSQESIQIPSVIAAQREVGGRWQSRTN
jgi:hypothetical protein